MPRQSRQTLSGQVFAYRNRQFGTKMTNVEWAQTIQSIVSLILLGIWGAANAQDRGTDVSEACASLSRLPNLSVTSSELVPARGTTASYCHVIGTIAPAIRYHLQLPQPDEWNGRLLHQGDGGPDGTLNFADHRVAQGYAVANSNSGHDGGSEPGWSFAHDNRQAEIDFGYRAVHLTVNAARTLIRAYYGESPAYSYHDGCSTGGRQGLVAAQRYPDDFDGIVAGAPVHDFQAMVAAQAWTLQRLFEDDFAGNLAFDADGDGQAESLRKVDLLEEAVLSKCDAIDGIVDGVIDNPLICDFDPNVDLAPMTCPSDVNGDACFTARQRETIAALYAGPTDGNGTQIYPGNAPGSEFSWRARLIPHAGNDMVPLLLRLAATETLAYLFYETDPGVPVPNPADLSYVPARGGTQPQVAWWEFDVNDVSAGLGDTMESIIGATDPDLTRFLIEEDAKLMIWHGWGDADPHPGSSLDYYQAVVDRTFDGDLDAAKERARLFMIPGMGHCGGGPGPNTWDTLAPIVEWVENGIAPDYLVVTHETDGLVDN